MARSRLKTTLRVPPVPRIWGPGTDAHAVITSFHSDALALFRWAVSERKRGHTIVSESVTGERKILVFPRLERVAPGERPAAR